MREIKQGPSMFFVGDSYESAQAWIDFSVEGHVLTITNTIVKNGLQGQGIGQRLVEHVIAYSRENEFKIIAQCPFAQSYFAKRPEHRDLLEGKNR
ncbi:MAG: N-acetyltransferase [Clostridia bacterium]|nr:N-acetyltransferase [Clostridia bacterium]NCC75785.1 N-acetyltransferase [Clostridia bacterium]